MIWQLVEYFASYWCALKYPQSFPCFRSTLKTNKILAISLSRFQSPPYQKLTLIQGGILLLIITSILTPKQSLRVYLGEGFWRARSYNNSIALHSFLVTFYSLLNSEKEIQGLPPRQDLSPKPILREYP